MTFEYLFSLFAYICEGIDRALPICDDVRGVLLCCLVFKG